MIKNEYSISQETLQIVLKALKNTKAGGTLQREIEMQDQDPTIPISNLCLTMRTHNIFAKNNITTLRDLLGMCENDLLKLKGFGKYCLMDVRRMLQEDNLSALHKYS